MVVPDGTRTCPLPLLLSAVRGAVESRVSRLSVVVALGTHAAMTEPELAAHLGCAGRNHEWWDPATLVDLGTIPAGRIAELSGGMLSHAVDVRINRAVVEHDVTLIVGPVFPHEVVGFSGGNKYLFPGVSGRELIDLSHWLGALITSAEIIGTPGVTPVRALIDEAASMVPGRRYALCVVTRSGGAGLCAAAFGEPEAAWAEAADVSAETHIRYLDAPVRRVLSLVSPRYDDLWTGAKGFYKVEPIVADGGEVVLYAPHIREVSVTPRQVAAIGYHCRDYFVEQWDRFRDVPWGDLAHSTHLRGAGTYDAASGEERFRVGSPSRRASPRIRPAPRTSTTAIRQRSIRPRGPPTPTRSSCRTRARCSTAFADRSHRAHEPGDALGDEIGRGDVAQGLPDDDLGARHVASEPFAVLRRHQDVGEAVHDPCRDADLGDVEAPGHDHAEVVVGPAPDPDPCSEHLVDILADHLAALGPGQLGAVGLGEPPLLAEILGGVGRDPCAQLRGLALQLGHENLLALQRPPALLDVERVHPLEPVEAGDVVRRAPGDAGGPGHPLRQARGDRERVRPAARAAGGREALDPERIRDRGDVATQSTTRRPGSLSDPP